MMRSNPITSCSSISGEARECADPNTPAASMVRGIPDPTLPGHYRNNAVLVLVTTYTRQAALPQIEARKPEVAGHFNLIEGFLPPRNRRAGRRPFPTSVRCRQDS